MQSCFLWVPERAFREGQDQTPALSQGSVDEQHLRPWWLPLLVCMEATTGLSQGMLNTLLTFGWASSVLVGDDNPDKVCWAFTPPQFSPPANQWAFYPSELYYLGLLAILGRIFCCWKHSQLTPVPYCLAIGSLGIFTLHTWCNLCLLPLHSTFFLLSFPIAQQF